MPDIVYDVIIALSLICAVLSTLLISRANDRERAFIYYIIAIGFFEVLAIILNRLLKDGNNLPGLHVYTLVQFLLLTVFFHECLKELTWWFRYKWVLVLGSVAIVCNSIFVQNIFTYNSYSKSIVELYIMLICVILFALFLRDKSHDQKSMKASVSFVSAVFLQSSVSIIFYLYSKEIVAMRTEMSDIAVGLKLGVTYLSLFMILLGMWQIYDRGRRQLAR